MRGSGLIDAAGELEANDRKGWGQSWVAGICFGGEVLRTGGGKLEARKMETPPPNAPLAGATSTGRR